MKNKIVLLLAGACLVLVIGAGTIRRDIIDTSAYTRSLATNETVDAWLHGLRINPVLTNFSGSSFGGGTNYLFTRDDTNAIGTRDGEYFTNILDSALQQPPLTNYFQFVGDVNTSISSRLGNSNSYNGTFNGNLTGLLTGTNANGDYGLFNNETRPVSLPTGRVAAATNVVSTLLTNNITTNAPITGSLVVFLTGRSTYSASSNLTYDGTVLTLTNQGSPTGLTLNTNGTINGNTPWTNSATVRIPTNTAPLNIAGADAFLVTGARNTLDANRGRHAVRVWGQFTNYVYVMLTNETTHSVAILGGPSTVGVATNGFNLIVFGSGGDTVTLTNAFSPSSTAGVAVFGSEDTTW